MYFPIGWPKYIHLQDSTRTIYLFSNRDRSLFGVLTEDSIGIWFAKPCVQIVCHKRSHESLLSLGINKIAEWKPDNRAIVVATSQNHLLFYQLDMDDSTRGLYEQQDSKVASLKRESAELFIKEKIPPLLFIQAFSANVPGNITSLVCIRDELMVSTTNGHIWRVHWDGTLNRDYCLNLLRIPFCADQQLSRALPLEETGLFVKTFEYSPLIGGFSIVLSNGKAAFITAPTLKFDPNQVVGIWAQELSTVTCTALNHRYRLIAYGLKSADGAVYCFDDLTGALVLTHKLVLSPKDFPDSTTAAGAVTYLKWSPDGMALAMAWEKGGLAVWSVFGSLLMCTLGWDYGSVESLKNNPFRISSLIRLYPEETKLDNQFVRVIKVSTQVLQLSVLGDRLLSFCADSHLTLYHLQKKDSSSNSTLHIVRLHELDVSNLVVHPACVVSAILTSLRTEIEEDERGPMSTSATKDLLKEWEDVISSKWQPKQNKTGKEHVFLQAEDRLFISAGADIVHQLHSPPYHSFADYHSKFNEYNDIENGYQEERSENIWNNTQMTIGNKQWIIVPIPYSYLGNNWPIRHACIDPSGQHVAVAGRSGLAHYSLIYRRWKLFGNETQEQDFVVMGGLLWWEDYLILGCYNLRDMRDEIRLYPEETKLDNQFVRVIKVSTQVLQLSVLGDRLLSFCADSHLTLYHLQKKDSSSNSTLHIVRLHELDVSNLVVHPACVVSAILTSLRTEIDALLPRIIDFIREFPVFLQTVVQCARKTELALWSYLFSAVGNPRNLFQIFYHHFYFVDALLPRIIDFIREFPVFLQTVVQCARKTELALWSYLFSAVGNPRNLFQKCLSQGHLETAASYLIILQNLEVASVSRQHATLLLDSALNANKWEVFRFYFIITNSKLRILKKCLSQGHLETAASYLIILQNLEVASVSRQHATLLLDSALNANKTRVAKVDDFITSLQTIHREFNWPFPIYAASSNLSLPRRSSGSSIQSSANVSLTGIMEDKLKAATVNTTKKKSSITHEIGDSGYLSNSCQDIQNNENNNILPDVADIQPIEAQLLPRTQHEFIFLRAMIKDKDTAEEFFIDTILTRHARKLLSAGRLKDLGYLSAHLDFHLVSFLKKERSEDESLLTLDMSEDSSLWGEEMHNTIENGWSGISLSTELEVMTQELASRGPPQSEVQLRYLLQLMLEAGCLDWSLLIAFVLRDAMAIIRVVNATRQPEFSQEIAQHLKDGLTKLENWIDTHCLGYKPFMLAIRNQVKALTKIITSRPQVLKLQGQFSLNNTQENSFNQEDEGNYHSLPNCKKNSVQETNTKIENLFNEESKVQTLGKTNDVERDNISDKSEKSNDCNIS
ncbi:RAB6A-GEF complex partner protein 1-like [Centruroides sculpturatus]|uniref:RAB6A-GEF complex partner protein 1-like n=1 Tax=Centruroides sculpturatus TaxID=218467 RepID=UPI000C6EA1F7|nr:RAB6A-GEF complex partner protein 1-like [Centruroides sculpturatus]